MNMIKKINIRTLAVLYKCYFFYHVHREQGIAESLFVILYPQRAYWIVGLCMLDCCRSTRTGKLPFYTDPLISPPTSHISHTDYNLGIFCLYNTANSRATDQTNTSMTNGRHGSSVHRRLSPPLQPLVRVDMSS